MLNLLKNLLTLNRVLLVLCAILFVACKAETTPTSESTTKLEAAISTNVSNTALEDAYKRKLSHVWVEGEGTVHKLLPDDNKGARHQKFLVKISADKTLLFAHNIDLAPRLDDLKVGDSIAFRGEYVYNPKGGVVHWTHRDPQGEKQGGWLKHNGKMYD